MPKRKLDEEIGSRWTTQDKVEAKDPLQMITQMGQQTEPAVADVQEQEARTGVPTQAPVHARTHTRTQTGRGASIRTHKGGIAIETLYEKVQNRKHLSSSTFRYQTDELKELEEIFAHLDKEKPGRLSRNDIARLGLIWLCEDFKQHGDESVLEQVLRRM